MVRGEWAVKRDSLGRIRVDLGADDFPINRLAPISKPRPGGGVRRRIVWELRKNPRKRARPAG
eukprot:4196481-Alexandrium_andersonii.AAC.1